MQDRETTNFSQVRETDIQMEGWNKLVRGTNWQEVEMIGFLSQYERKNAGKNVRQLVFKFPYLYTNALMFLCV